MRVVPLPDGIPDDYDFQADISDQLQTEVAVVPWNDRMLLRICAHLYNCPASMISWLSVFRRCSNRRLPLKVNTVKIAVLGTGEVGAAWRPSCPRTATKWRSDPGPPTTPRP